MSVDSIHDANEVTSYIYHSIALTNDNNCFHSVACRVIGIRCRTSDNDMPTVSYHIIDTKGDQVPPDGPLSSAKAFTARKWIDMFALLYRLNNSNEGNRAAGVEATVCLNGSIESGNRLSVRAQREKYVGPISSLSTTRSLADCV